MYGLIVEVRERPRHSTCISTGRGVTALSLSTSRPEAMTVDRFNKSIEEVIAFTSRETEKWVPMMVSRWCGENLNTTLLFFCWIHAAQIPTDVGG